MERLVKGDVVVVPFPFTDLSGVKRRPALVVAHGGDEALLLCQITSQGIRDGLAIPLDGEGFEEGGLRVVSNVRPNRLFTADSTLVSYRAGRVKRDVVEGVIVTIKSMLDAEPESD